MIKDVPRKKEQRKVSGTTMVEILRSMFKSFGNNNELIITHPTYIQTSVMAQQILDNQEEIKMLKSIIVDLKQREKKTINEM